MATITGLRLSQLQALTLGSTGTLFYAASANSNSYRIYEKDLYNTLYTLHLSGALQPKNEDWRFVHITGNESITGEKTFVNNVSMEGFLSVQGQISTPLIEDQGIAGINIYYSNGLIKDSNVLNTLIDCVNRNLYGVDGSTITLDWGNRRLSGQWDVQDLTISGQPIATGNLNFIANKMVLTTGNQNISGQKTFFGPTIFYNPAYSVNYLNFQSGTNGYLNFSDNSSIETIHTVNRTTRDSTNAVSIDWENKRLSGIWRMNNQQIPTGNRVVMTTGNQNISGTKTFWGIVEIPLFSLYVDNILSYSNPSTFGVVSTSDGLLNYGGATSIDWKNRLLENATAETMLDWGNKILSGNWNASNIVTPYISGTSSSRIEVNNNKLYDSVNSPSIDWSLRQLFFNGLPTVDYGLTKSLYSAGGVSSLDWRFRVGADGNAVQSYDWHNRLLQINDTTTTVDWSGRILSGVWNIQQLRMITPILSGLAPSTPTSAGASGQLAMSGQKLFIATGNNQWGYINITPW